MMKKRASWASCVELHTVSTSAAASKLATSAAGFDRMRAAAVLLEVDGQAVRRRRNGGIGVAVALDEIDQQVALAVDVHVGRAGCERIAAVRRGGQFLDVDLDQRQRVLGDVALVGDDQRDRFADVSDLPARQDERRNVRRQNCAWKLQRQPVRGEDAPQIGQRVDRVDARKGARRAGVDRRGSVHARSGCAGTRPREDRAGEGRRRSAPRHGARPGLRHADNAVRYRPGLGSLGEALAQSMFRINSRDRFGAHPPLEGEGRERSERGGVTFFARMKKHHPTPPASASLRQSTLPLQGRVKRDRAWRCL